MNKSIGAQFYTIREHCQNEADFENSCKKVKEMGYSVVQLSGIGDIAPEAIKSVLDKYELTVACTHRPAERYLENLEEEIKFHKLINCNVCGLGCIPGFNVEDENIDDFISKFKPVCKRLNEEGLIFAYHNHSLEFEKKNGVFVMDTIIEKMNEPNFKLILDVYWLSYSGVNPAEYLRSKNGVTACVHLKDLRMKGPTHHFCEVGQGTIHWVECLKACEESDVLYALVEQDDCYGKDPFLCLKESRDFLVSKGYN